MKIQDKNLLSKAASNRAALSWKLPKIKLGFPKRFTKLAIIFFILTSLLGYYPTLNFPPVKKSIIKAEYQQQGEVIAQSFSQAPILPHPGYLTTKFSSYHPGIDIAIGLGMPIHPILPGTVLQAGRDFFGLGNYVVVVHEKGYESKYAHMGAIFVKAGDEITSDNILGEVGLTGNTSGPHTHLEVTRNSTLVDPQILLPEIAPLPLVTAKK